MAYPARCRLIQRGTFLVLDPINDLKYIFVGEADLKAILENFMRKIPNSEGALVWQCKSCNLIKKTKYHLEEHIEAAHVRGLQFKCPYCVEYKKTRKAVRAHVHLSHHDEHLVYKMNMVLMC